jgi:hypothetical protein
MLLEALVFLMVAAQQPGAAGAHRHTPLKRADHSDAQPLALSERQVIVRAEVRARDAIQTAAGMAMLEVIEMAGITREFFGKSHSTVNHSKALGARRASDLVAIDMSR